MNTGKIVIFTLLGTLVVGGSAFAYSRLGKGGKNGNNKKTSTGTQGGDDVGGGGGIGDGSAAEGFPLAKGSKGSNVKKWQQYLIGKKLLAATFKSASGKMIASDDGDFGAMTEEATKKAINKAQVSLDDFNEYILGRKKASGFGTSSFVGYNTNLRWKEMEFGVPTKNDVISGFNGSVDDLVYGKTWNLYRKKMKDVYPAN